MYYRAKGGGGGGGGGEGGGGCRHCIDHNPELHANFSERVDSANCRSFLI